jgi:trans-aconitate methyltransferase
VRDRSFTTADWADVWQGSWDRLEEGLMRGREQRIGVLPDLVEGLAATAPQVLDLACGPGTITRRLLARLPAAHSVALDADPVLLTIASATFADDDRVRVVRSDLRDPAWLDAMPEPQVDAVLTATALHWLPEHVVCRLYSDLAGVVRPGGVFAHAEEMPLVGSPSLRAVLAAAQRMRRKRASVGPRTEWDAWWEQAASDPALSAAMAERQTVFATSYPTEEFSPPAEWHIAALSEAGFAEAGVVWRSGDSAVVAAVR